MKLDSFLKYFCHRKPERTFKVKGYYFPVCARCTGIYISMLVSLILLWNIQFNSISSALIAIILIIPMGIDGTTQLLGMRLSNNKLRLITGLLGGVGLVILSRFLGFFFSFMLSGLIS
jgi:uncharacterized membrane protein